jgi:hypothetical protein
LIPRAEVGNALFDSLVAESGLAPLFAATAIKRACTRAGIDARTLTRRDIARALPALEQALRVYLPEPQVQTRLAAIERLAQAPGDSAC